MFYSQMLLSKKGPLGTIWIAAHFHKKLKKEQVNQTNISSSVDKILHDEVPVVTYRILGFLLLGVVRIYSKKVEYLFHDCRDALSKLGDAPSGRGAKLSIEGLRAPYHSIALPERFELDAFNLGVSENQNLSSERGLRSPKEIMLKDTGNEDKVRFGSFGKYHHEEDPSHSEAHLSGRTPVRDILSPDFMDIEMGVSSSQSKRVLDLGLDNFHENRFFLEECLEPLTLGEAEEEGLIISFGKDLQTNGKQLNRGAGVNLEEEPPAMIKPVDTGKHAEAEMMSIREVTSSESRMHQSTKENPPSITVDLTPQSKLPGHHGDNVPEVMAVRTPAAKERTRVLRKRKYLYDDQIIVPNEIFKHWISDSHALVCKRKKAPHTALRAWKAHKISNLPQSFTETLIPSLVDFRDVIGEKVHRTQEKGQTAPSTPPVHSTSVSSHQVQDVPVPDVLEPATPTESMEKGRSLSEDHRFGFCLTDEEISSCYGDSQQTSRSSDSLRTRAVAEYLYKKFVQNKRQKKEKVIRLSQISKGKSKKESARLFYEILVLTTRNYIDVRQDNAYDDILLIENPVLEQSFGAEAVYSES